MFAPIFLVAVVNCRLVNPEFDLDVDAFQEPAENTESSGTASLPLPPPNESESEGTRDTIVEESSTGVGDPTTGDPGSTDLGEVDVTSSGEDTEDMSSTDSTSSSSTTNSSSTDPDSSSADTGGLTTESDTSGDCTPSICLRYNDGNSVDSEIFPYDRLYAIPMTSDADHTIISVEVYTGGKSGMQGLAIWSSIAGLPIAELRAATWMSDDTVGWQGVNFDQPFEVSSGEGFVVVWDALEGSQGSVAATGEQISGYSSTDDGRSWIVNSWRWKVRVYCCDPDSL